MNDETIKKAFADGENVFPSEWVNDFPSRFIPGDTGVKIVIPDRGTLEYGNVTKVHFTKNKVSYDLEFPFFTANGKRGYTRIHNVDSAFVDDMHWQPSMTDPKNTGKEEDFVIDQRYQQNSRGRWELKPEHRGVD